MTEAWTGPQVAWKMARGYDGAFGRKINNPWIWLSLCAVFFIGLADLRRPLSIRNLDLLVLLSFGISLYFFNSGEVFTAMPLVYPPLLYLLGRMAWIGWKGRGSSSQPLWPVWVLLAATVFLAGFRFGMNVRASNVIDVGLAGVIGAQRIVEDGESPYGNMPTTRARSAASRTPTATSASGSRRTGAARWPTAAATRTARSATSPTSRASSPWATTTSGTPCRPRTSRPSSGTRSR